MNFNDVAILLDLDNVVIGAAEVNLTFDINLILEHIKKLTNGRIVLRRAYGDWQQHQRVTKELATAGFELQSIVRLSHMSKNLADMQMVVDAMDTLIDGHKFTTYVLVTGDRDFVPLVQALRKRGKQVIGIGLKHTSSKGLVNLCDEYVYYEELTPPSHRLQEADVEKLLRQAMEQLLKDKSRVPASLLKQHLHALSHGGFTRSKQGRKNFRALLGNYPAIVQVEQDGTTLYVRRPPDKSAAEALPSAKMSEAAPSWEQLLQRALEKIPPEQARVRASLLKQWLQELSDGSFGDSLPGHRTFRQFLEQYPHLVAIANEGSTLFVGPSGAAQTPRPATAVPPVPPLAEAEVETLLQQALADLLAEQPRPRASLLKQRMQALSNGAFDESAHGCANFRQFLEQYPHLLALQQTGSTLFIARPQGGPEPADLHLRYRTLLKKQGLRVVPANIRLLVLRDLLNVLPTRESWQWHDVVEQLTTDYQQKRPDNPISKSFINDVMRLAQRARIIGVPDNTPWSSAPVRLQISGERAFQDAVMRCDAAYLRGLQNTTAALDIEEAAIALYDSNSHARYLRVVMNQYPGNGRPADEEKSRP